MKISAHFLVTSANESNHRLYNDMLSHLTLLTQSLRCFTANKLERNTLDRLTEAEAFLKRAEWDRAEIEFEGEKAINLNVKA